MDLEKLQKLNREQQITCVLCEFLTPYHSKIYDDIFFDNDFLVPKSIILIWRELIGNLIDRGNLFYYFELGNKIKGFDGLDILCYAILNAEIDLIVMELKNRENIKLSEVDLKNLVFANIRKMSSVLEYGGEFLKISERLEEALKIILENEDGSLFKEIELQHNYNLSCSHERIKNLFSFLEDKLKTNHKSIDDILSVSPSIGMHTSR